MRTLASLPLCAVALALSLLGSAATAQVFNMGGLTATLSQDVNTQSEERRSRIGERLRGPVFQPRPSAPRINPEVARARFRFTSSPAVRKQTYARLVADIRRTDPKAAASAQAELARRDFLSEIRGAYSRAGIDTYNTADALASYIVAAWHAAHGDDGGTPAEVKAVRRQIALSLGDVPGLSTGSSAQKQSAAEFYLLQTLFAEQSIQAAKGSPGRIAELRAAFRRGGQQNLGVDLMRVRIDGSGFHA